jgi:signal peptidase II
MTLSSYLYGPLSRFGIVVAVLAAATDQGTKVWLLRVFDLPAKVPVHLGPFIDLVLAWNTGISFSLFPQVGPLGQWALLGVKGVAVALLWVWLARAGSRLTALAIGLIIGGALGNAIDRAVYGAVADFVLFHIATETWTFRWYVFNLADVAIVAGVVGLLYESILAKAPQKRPDP